ncbi:MAG: hypothetical protein LBH66_06760 [Oscillospiraceae bacterium]|jgi:hypothetical protein|nr:hypothetical protein [Oscillospiraceae bacterium]
MPINNFLRHGNTLVEALSDDSNFVDDVPYTDESSESFSVTEPAGDASDVQRIIQQKLSGIEITSPVGTPISPDVTNDFEIKSVAGDSGLPFFAEFRLQGESDVQMTTKKRNQRTRIDLTLSTDSDGILRATLPPGSFAITQQSTQPGYLLNALHHDLQVGTSGYVIDGVYFDETPGIITPKLSQPFKIRILTPDDTPSLSTYIVAGYANTYLGETDVELTISPDADGYASFDLPVGHYSLINPLSADTILLDLDVQPTSPNATTLLEYTITETPAPPPTQYPTTPATPDEVSSPGDLLELYTPLSSLQPPPTPAPQPPKL